MKTLTPNYIPFSVPVIGEEEIQEVTDVLRSGWITTGARTAQFEKEFAEYTRCDHALAVNSCTAGLHLALAALGIGPGDEVITTPLTFCASVNVILHVGATPVLADIGPDGNIDPESIRARVTSRTRAILPVHLAGFPCDMEAIWKIAREHNLYVVEDAAHAIGTTYRGEPLGSRAGESDAVAFSFYATKNLTTGEGGMVTTNNPELSDRMRVLCLHGISRDAWNRYNRNGSWFYDVLEPGFKYNLSDIQSAIGIHQLRKLESFIERRENHVRMYNELLENVAEIETPVDAVEGRHAWHLYAIRLNLDQLSIDRGEFIEKLREADIGASVHFIPIPLHSFFAPWAGRQENQCPRALELYPRLISLPLYPSLDESDVRYICSVVKDIVAQNRKHSTVGICA
jgi:dTDP-4-amino-4,6-dideoxygalactose transaminase